MDHCIKVLRIHTTLGMYLFLTEETTESSNFLTFATNSMFISDEMNLSELRKHNLEKKQ